MKSLNRRPFLFPKTREAYIVESQEDMSIDGTPGKTPQASRKKIRGIEYGGEHRWSTLDKVVMAKLEHYLDRSESLEVDTEELEYYLIGPDVDIRHIERNTEEKGNKGFSTL